MIKLTDLTKIYDSKKNSQTVLKGINLEVKRGEMLAIMGRSGAGKSTLLNILAGLEKATTGGYIFLENDMTELNSKQLSNWRKNNVGFILQSHTLIDEKNVFENVALPLHYARKTKKEIRSKVMDLLKYLNLEDKEKKYPRELSGGESQRVAIARALVNNPNIILADEPTGALDEETEKVILNLFKQINEQGKTFILVTHDHTVSSICDRTIIIKDGIIQ